MIWLAILLIGAALLSLLTALAIHLITLSIIGPAVRGLVWIQYGSRILSEYGLVGSQPDVPQDLYRLSGPVYAVMVLEPLLEAHGPGSTIVEQTAAKSIFDLLEDGIRTIGDSDNRKLGDRVEAISQVGVHDAFFSTQPAFAPPARKMKPSKISDIVRALGTYDDD